jgi:hypothetical protein
MEYTHIHKPSNQKCRIKKVYGSIATVYVEPYPICIMWGKAEYSDTIIVKVEDLEIIQMKLF